MSSARYCMLVADSESYPGVGSLIEQLGADSTLQLEVFDDPSKALEAIQKRPPLLLIAQPDWATEPDFLSQASQAIQPCPTIALVKTSATDDVMELLAGGASDLLALPITDRNTVDHILSRNLERAELLNQSQYFRDELEQSLALLKEDQQAGRQVQLKMLPSNQIVINDYHFEYRIKPSLFLSGDFVDYFRISESLSMFYLADISGHGASSAFVTVLLKNMTNRLLRNYNRGSSFHILSPTDVLARVNKELLDTGLGKHMTIFVGLLDRIENTLQYGVGGHFPMPILRQGDRAEYLGGCGMPVGLFDDAEFEGRIVELEDEFSLTLFSDGVLEVLDQPDLKAKEKCLLDVAAQGYDDLDDLARKLGIDHVDDAPDDIAALSVTRRL
ncbi:PP2C family protein-serine/threonine phosphatase [Motiliproteus sp.]|uniref:PP2C family protein-serine/threonine phosphatase n=1 Tax=Motiliproteus sp. TaxID=1898955 RepID=UPI003BADA821